MSVMTLSEQITHLGFYVRGIVFGIFVTLCAESLVAYLLYKRYFRKQARDKDIQAEPESPAAERLEPKVPHSHIEEWPANIIDFLSASISSSGVDEVRPRFPRFVKLIQNRERKSLVNG
jgi:hypothetical protein